MALTASISSASSGIRYVEKGAYSRITWLRLGFANPNPNPNPNPKPNPNPSPSPNPNPNVQPHHRAHHVGAVLSEVALAPG